MCLSISPIYLSIYLPTYLYIYLSICLSVSVYLSSCKLENEAILRDFLIFRSWQHQKRSNAARLLHFLNWTTSKTKQFCETSSIFELDNIKNKRILRDFLQKWKVKCSAGSFVPMRFGIFPLHLSKVLRLPRKIDARSYEVLHLSRKIILAHLQIWCSKMQPLSGNQRPDLLTSLMNMSFVLRPPQKMHLCRYSSNVHACHGFWKCDKTLTFCTIPSACQAKRHLNFQTWREHMVFCTFWLRHVLRATTACTFSTSQLPKVVRTWCVLYILTSKCASRHNGGTFSTSQLPKVVRTWGAFSFFTYKCASHHNGVHFFVSHLARWLHTRRFSEPTFRPSGATNPWKNTVFRDFPTFSRICIFFLWLFLFYSSLF